ncbi:hypothetical protein [Phytomonospora endophytica]|uniref:Uncharacterized protein n=1 Tax=Phytomonospora endophytica TaxID=714109 RepID=A0A841FT89_9ACTN|nr:hypothetical protein [Phytomonospora endophytica]MBB6039515.1 hypothetical protein [Phytomonospora endophytica]GIG70479.1 hypothetical protein Pen01_67740 [Phytomonospora endophytica]
MSLAESLQQVAAFAQNGLPFDGVSLLREKLTQSQGFVQAHAAGGMQVQGLNAAHQALVQAQEHLNTCEQMMQAAKEAMEGAVRMVGGG